MRLVETWEKTVKRLKSETYTLFLAYKDPKTPWYAKVVVAGIVAYALSPIDLIPDFIPVLGLLDDFILIPVGITIAIKMIPAEVLRECRRKAEKRIKEPMPKKWLAGIIILCIWAGVLMIVVLSVIRWIRR